MRKEDRYDIIALLYFIISVQFYHLGDDQATVVFGAISVIYITASVYYRYFKKP